MPFCQFIFPAILLGCIIVYVICCKDVFLKDVETFVKVVRDDAKQRRAKAEEQNEQFVDLMRGANKKVSLDKANDPTDTLLEEARKNLGYSYDLRNQENQSMLSVTATIVSMYGAFFYLANLALDMDSDSNIFVFNLALAAMCLLSLVIASAFMLEGFRPTYLIPNSTEEDIRKILQKQLTGDMNAEESCSEIKYTLIAACGVRSKVNEESNILKSMCWDATRRYMRYAGIFLLLMLITWSIYKLCASSVTCCC